MMIDSPALRRPSEKSEESSKSRRTDEEQGDSLLPPKRRAYSNRSLTRVVSSTHPGESSWTCKSCSYQNADRDNTACAVCGTDHKPVRQLQPRGASVAPCDSFSSSYASGIASLDTAKISELGSVNNSAKEARPSSLDKFLLTRDVSASGRRRRSSDADSQGSAATVRVSNKAEDHFWRTRNAEPEPVAEEEDEPSRSSSASTRSRVLRNEGSNGGLQPPTPRSEHHSPLQGDRGRYKRSESSDGGFQPPQSTVRHSSRAHRERHTSVSEPQQQGTTGGYQPVSFLSTRHGSVGEEPQLLTARHDSVVGEPVRVLSSPDAMRQPSTSDITFSPSSAERSNPQDSRAFLASPVVDPLASLHDKSEMSPKPRSLNRGGTRSIPTGDSDDNRSTSEISTFADENSLTSMNKPFFSRRGTFLTIVATICILAVAAAVVVTILLVGRPKMMSLTNADETKTTLNPTISPLSTLPSASPSRFETRPPTFPPKSLPTIGPVVTGRETEDQFGGIVQLAAEGTVMAVSSKSTAIQIYNLTTKKAWRLVWEVEVEGGTGGAHPIALSSDGTVLAELVLGRVKTYEFANGTWQKRGDPIETDRQQKEGSALSLSSDGSILVIALADDGSGTEGRVAAYSYGSMTGTQSTWNSLGKPIQGYSASSGFDVDLSEDGKRLAIASWKKRRLDSTYQDAGIVSRQVRTYQFRGLDWETYGPQLELRNPEPPDQSSASVSLSDDGNTMAACASLDCSVYLYDTLRNYSTRISLLPIGNGLHGGNDVSLSGNGEVLVVGMSSTGVGGAIQVYEITAQSTSSSFEVKSANADDHFGQAVSISGQSVAVGSPMNDAGGQNAGSVQVYSLA